MTDVGFIGLGNMGGPMLANLVKAGHKVKAFDLSADAMARAAEAGAVSLIGDVKAGSILCLRCNKNIRRLADHNGARTPW